jgi:hypothetical protein
MRCYIGFALVLLFSTAVFFLAFSQGARVQSQEHIYLWIPPDGVDPEPHVPEYVHVGFIATYDGNCWESHYTRGLEPEVREWQSPGRAAGYLRCHYMGME